MHALEPYYNWRHLYVSSEDVKSPFYGREYSEFEYSQLIYNYFIHPQWDNFGSSSLFCKILYADYDEQFVIIEFIGEWNDCINNDVMLVKNEVINPMIEQGIKKFILVGENLLNAHCDDSSYYEEWFEDLDEGWITALNFRKHVYEEFKNSNIDFFLNFGGIFDDLNWRKFTPTTLLLQVEQQLSKRLAM